MGKWSHLKGQYPDRQDPESDYFRDLHARTDELATKKLAELAELYAKEEEIVDYHEKRAKSAKTEIEAITRAMLRVMEQQNLDSATLAGYRWTPSPEPYPQVKDKVSLREWAEKTDQRDLLSINPQTLKSLVKKALEENQPIPEGLDLFVHTTFSRRKA